MSIRLRDFIRNIRSCKTAAEERAVIAKECALIRTAFKEGDGTYRHRNLAKLLFVHMMGYPCHFGQMECLKLIASPRFAEKRIGYLGLNQILDEGTELLMLVTNSIKNDLHHPSQYVNGLALTALGNIGSSEMCRSLAREVEDLCSYGNPYVRKKAILCAMRLIRKVEDVAERFIPLIPSFFEEKNHGVLLSACSLVTTLLERQPRTALPDLSKITPQLLACLKRVMILSGYSSSAEYDVFGVTDPFLQTKLLKTIRLLEEGSPEVSEDVADALSQVAASTETSKGSGNAVLLECANTILAVKADVSLTALGVGILGRFLQNKDSNIRYVGLSAIQQVAKVDKTALQKHCSTIIECLKDPDTSIRRRALEVIYSLVNEESISTFFKELMSLLTETPDNSEELDFRLSLVSKICTAIERYAPTRRWQIDATIRVFSVAGDIVPIEVWRTFIFLITLTPELQGYATRKLYEVAQEHPDQHSLVAAAIWTIGEFGTLLLDKVSATEILDFLDTCAHRTTATCGFRSSLGNLASKSPGGDGFKNAGLLLGRSILLESTSTDESHGVSLPDLLVTSLVKLTTRLPDEEHTSRIKNLLGLFNSSLSIELQQRACEYERLLLPQWDEFRPGIFDTMPLVSQEIVEGTCLAFVMERPTGSTSESASLGALDTADCRASKDQGPMGTLSGDLLDMDGLLDEAASVPTSSLPTNTLTVPSEAPNVNVEDLLADIFGQPSSSSSPPKDAPGAQQSAMQGNDTKSVDVFQLACLL